jgi:tRNA G18 (ribose-2'-O)-methylase SpoU
MAKLANIKFEISVILHNIRSSENVGSIFRTCDALSVSKIILCGYTPSPEDRFGRQNKKLCKASLGAEKSVKWEKAENLSEAIENIKKAFPKYLIVAVEQSENSVDYKQIKKLASSNLQLGLVFGNEVSGLSKEELELCDAVAEIPIKGFLVREANHPQKTKLGKESLNVAVTVGVVLYSLTENQ